MKTKKKNSNTDYLRIDSCTFLVGNSLEEAKELVYIFDDYHMACEYALESEFQHVYVCYNYIHLNTLVVDLKYKYEPDQ